MKSLLSFTYTLVSSSLFEQTRKIRSSLLKWLEMRLKLPTVIFLIFTLRPIETMSFNLVQTSDQNLKEIEL